jgi:molecular chaperone GrpE
MAEAAESSAPASGSDAIGGIDEAAQLRQRLEAAEAAAGVAREQYLRSMAELENVRKRAERDVQSAHRYALERFAGELLTVRDTLELAVKNAATADARSLAEGQEATLRLLAKAFDKFAIQQISPRGAPFDPQVHEAVLSQPSSSVPAGHVIDVLQAGYQLNGRLLRPARVIVARAPGSP